MSILALGADDTRLVYLAVATYLASPRPAAEVAAMRPLLDALDGHLPAQRTGAEIAGVRLDLAPHQAVRLGDALYALINELKQFEVAAGRSAAPGFSEAVLRTFPEAHPDGGGEPGAALDLVAEAMALRRRLEPALREAATALREERETAAAVARAAGRRWWKVWRR